MVSVRQVSVEGKKKKRLRRKTFFKTWLLYSACSIIYSFFFFLQLNKVYLTFTCKSPWLDPAGSTPRGL